VPESVPQEVVETARESVGAAVIAAENSPGISEAVETSFSIAIQSVYGIGGAGFLLLIGFIFWKFRDVGVESHEKDDAAADDAHESLTPQLTESGEAIN